METYHAVAIICCSVVDDDVAVDAYVACAALVGAVEEPYAMNTLIDQVLLDIVVGAGTVVVVVNENVGGGVAESVPNHFVVL